MREKVKTYDHGPIGDILEDMAEGSKHYDYSVIPIETLQHWREHESFTGETDGRGKVHKNATVHFEEKGHRWDVKYYECLNERSLNDEKDMCFIASIKRDGHRIGGSNIKITDYEKVIKCKRNQIIDRMNFMMSLSFMRD